MYKYHCLNPIAKEGIGRFGENYSAVDKPEEADVILVRSAKMHEMKRSDNLLCIARAGAGVNNIPLDECAKEGIVVFNTPGANANSVKEAVFAAMILSSRGIFEGYEWCMHHADDSEIKTKAESIKKQFGGREIAGKKLGVIGLGAIGVRVATEATHVGMDVYGYDPFISVDAAWHLSRNVKHIDNVDDIFRECDFISIHVPLSDATRGLIDKRAVSLMKETAVLLNFARDELVDESAVVEALKEGKLKHYASDFPNTITAGQPGVFLFPHLGATTSEAEENCAIMAVRQIVDYMENGNITNSVNAPNCNMGVCHTKGRIAILHRNIRGFIAKVTAILDEADINVADLTNKSKGELAYTLIDIDSVADESVESAIMQIEDVIRYRKIK